MTDNKPLYDRILLKLSGEALMGDKDYGLCPETVDRIARDIKKALDLGVEISIVIGGGNIFRGVSGASQGMDRSTADYMGMLATVINCLAMQNALEKTGIDTRVQSAIPMNEVCEPYIRRRAMRHLEKGRIVIFAAGTGNPYFTSDTAAALRASEMRCDALMKATKVDGIYSDDPVTNPKAKRFQTLSYMDVLSRDLKVMDASAISLARENDIPVIIFSLNEADPVSQAIVGKGRFSVVSAAVDAA